MSLADFKWNDGMAAYSVSSGFQTTCPSCPKEIIPDPLEVHYVEKSGLFIPDMAVLYSNGDNNFAVKLTLRQEGYKVVRKDFEACSLE